MSVQRLSDRKTKDHNELLRRAIDGDQASWNALITHHSPMVRAVVAGYRLDHDTAADVCQTVWLRLYEYAPRIRKPEALGGWLATTARNEALRCIRGLQRSRPVGEMADEADLNAPSPDERAIDDETLADVLGAFRRLSEESKQLMRLLVASPPLPYQDIAERVGRPVGSIGPTRSRCIEALKSHMVEPVPALAA
ncbi:MAG: sigma-70 family RNA polymerase sigma factor [Actinomycetota bacterium]